jgi:hypothetical protein
MHSCTAMTEKPVQVPLPESPMQVLQETEALCANWRRDVLPNLVQYQYR